MKFTDGNWMMQPGVTPFYPGQAYEVTETPRGLDIFATRPVRHRGDTLDGPALDIRLSSPLPDVIRVTVSHFRGGADIGPHFETADEAAEILTSVDEQAAILTSGALTARISRSPYGLEFLANGKTVTRSGERGLGLMRVAGTGSFVQEQLTIGVGENIYGLGERFTALVKNGQSVEIWNRDGGTGSDQAYKNVPFYLSSRGYGVFVNHPGRVEFEVASEKVSRVGFAVPGESLDYFVIYGPTPKEVLRKYTALTGRPTLPPQWSFGLWLTTSFTTSYDEATVTSFIAGMEERNLPLSVIHFDCFWMREFRWCDFEWDTRVFPDPPAMLRRLHERGLKVCVWINPYIAGRSPLFREAAEAGYLLKNREGVVWQSDQWQAGMGIVDFTNPGACRWYADKLRALTQMGVDSFKTDFGERIPVDEVAWFDGSDPGRMHNYYAQLYNQCVFEVLEDEVGQGEATLFARSATAGGQKFPVHWGGDCASTFESMAESLRGGLSLCLSGFGFWSHDIGGFEGTPPAELYKRWLAFGLLSSHSRLHGSTSYRVPWLFDEEAVDVLRHFAQLKNRLMPYLYRAAVEAHQTGIPVMRAMLLEFPDDPAAATLDRQYLLGESLLVAPVFAEGGAVDYYLPEGRWTHLLNGEVVTGPGWRRETHDVFSLPVLARPNTLLAVRSSGAAPEYTRDEEVILRLYELEDGGSVACEVPYPGAAPFHASVLRTGDRLELKVSGQPPNWRLQLVNRGVLTVEGGEFERLGQDTVVRPAPDAGPVVIVLASRT